MKVYAVLSSGAVFFGPAMIEARAELALVTFYDHPKVFTSLSLKSNYKGEAR